MHNFTKSQSLRVFARTNDRIVEQARALNRTPITIVGVSLVNALADSDRIAAMLTSDKFVIRERSDRQLGTLLLDSLNRDEFSRPAARASAASEEKPTVNNFGGISIHVREASDVNSVVRDLRFQGLQLRNRRG